MNEDSLALQTYLVDSIGLPPIVYDEMRFVRDSDETRVFVPDSLPTERLELPARYEGRTDMRVRRFLNRRQARLEHQD